MGAPGWPELAFCTPSIESVRMVFTTSSSRAWRSIVVSVIGLLVRSLARPYPVSTESPPRGILPRLSFRPRRRIGNECGGGPVPAMALPKGAWSRSDRMCPVSYTHLRAHETDSYLVCRLL